MRPLGRCFGGFGFGLCSSFGQNRSRSRRGGKVEIARFVRDFQGSVGAGENLLLVFPGFHAPAFSTALLGYPADQLFARAAIASHYVRAVADRNRFVQVFVDGDCATRQRAAEARLLDLPHSVADRDRVVLATIRSVCIVNTQSRSGRPERRKALAFCSGATANWRLKTSM